MISIGKIGTILNFIGFVCWILLWVYVDSVPPIICGFFIGATFSFLLVDFMKFIGSDD